MDLNLVRDALNPTIRLWLYVLYVIAAIVIGAIAAWTDGTLEWIPAAERTLTFLMVPLGVLAAANVTRPDDEYED